METQVRSTPITGKEGAEIELKVAADWTKNHRERHPHGSISQFFGTEILQRLLSQPGCLGIRIYYANSQRVNGWQKFILAIANFLKKELAGAVGEDHFILVGATAEGLDQLPKDNKVEVAAASTDPHTFKNMVTTDTTTGTVVEQSYPCPGSAGCPKNALTGS